MPVANTIEIEWDHKTIYVLNLHISHAIIWSVCTLYVCLHCSIVNIRDSHKLYYIMAFYNAQPITTWSPLSLFGNTSPQFIGGLGVLLPKTTILVPVLPHSYHIIYQAKLTDMTSIVLYTFWYDLISLPSLLSIWHRRLCRLAPNQNFWWTDIPFTYNGVTRQPSPAQHSLGNCHSFGELTHCHLKVSVWMIQLAT